MHRPFLMIAAILSAVAVGLGAIGTHTLKQVVSAETLGIFETGVRYHFYHCFALFVTAIVYERFRTNRIIYAAYAFIAGIAFFSGSLYLITFLHAKHYSSIPGLWVITPLGGLFFIVGWLLLFMAFITRQTNPLKSI